MELTKSEMEIMDVFWNSKLPLSRSDLLGHGEEKSWKDSSVHILLNGLLQKGALSEVGFVRRNKTYGRTFLPTLSREEYFARKSESFVEETFQGSLPAFLAAFTARKKLTPQEVAQLRQMVAQYGEE